MRPPGVPGGGEAGSLYIGTSGFAYGEWKGVFYPDDIREREMLPFYAARFRSVEVNYTFRRQPSERTLASWREQSPQGFLFALKAHQRITHTLRLEGAAEALAFFLGRVRGLGDRLGPILFQCPPSLRYDRGRLESFLSHLPPEGRYAMEFRHPSWEEARSLLAGRGVAWCTADTDQVPASEPAAEPFCYLRLRRNRYTEEELRAWGERLSAILATGREVFCYLKHEEKGTAPVFAERLAAFV